jgi:hypothetical protein
MSNKNVKDKKKDLDFFASLFPDDDSKFDDRQVWWGASTGISLLGVESGREIIGALLCHTLAWYNEGQGPSVIYNFLSGVRLRRGQYWFAAVPIFTDFTDMDLLEDDSNFAHILALAAGYFASNNKLV